MYKHRRPISFMISFLFMAIIAMPLTTILYDRIITVLGLANGGLRGAYFPLSIILFIVLTRKLYLHIKEAIHIRHFEAPLRKRY